MAIKNKGKVWMRMGDNDDYHDFDNMFDAGVEVGVHISVCFGTGEKAKMPEIGRHDDTGITMPGFKGYNYISLFWGDNDAQLIKGHTQTDIAELKRGIREGADIPFHTERRLFHGVSVKRLAKRKTAKPSGLGGIR